MSAGAHSVDALAKPSLSPLPVMVSLASLWLPIMLAAIAVFFLSTLAHAVLKYHESDFQRLPDEDAILASLGPHNLPVGEYMFPHLSRASGSPAKDPAFIERRTRGPAGILTVMPNGMPPLAGFLATWFVYTLLCTILIAYLASRTLPTGAEGSEIFRVTATTAFLAYGVALPQDSIWFGRRWSTTIKNLFDALVYGAATAAIFVWLWPAT